MPELPEVETVKNVLKNIIIGSKISKIDINRKSIIHGDPDVFKNALLGQTFLDITRKGKFLFLHLTNDLVIISHLRMEGKYYDFSEEENNSKYARVVFHFTNGRKLCYDDSRTFGMMILSDENHYLKEKEVAKLGHEPFDIKDVDYLLKATSRSRLPIKTALLDQSLMTGLGNIYVDETLYASRIHPWTSANKITKDEWLTIVKNAQDILNIAIEMGGSTIKSYHPGKDIDGNFQTRIKIYGKENETCPICGHTYRFVKTNGRGTTFCPGCQQKKGQPINIAITGKVSSGKSSILKAFQEKGYDTLSSDEIVSNLYKEDNVIENIEKIINYTFNNKEDIKSELREKVLGDLSIKKKIEKYIHPLVEKEISKFLLTSKSPLRAVEVPLLFESKLDRLFDDIIISDISSESQLKLISKRNPDKAKELLELNKNNKIEENKNKATYLISNNGDIQDFNKEISKVINRLISRLD